MKKLNQEQFVEYIKKNGITKAKLSLSYYHTPKETILWFGLHNENISTYDEDTKYKNKEFGYKFNYQWLFYTYKGDFIIEDEEMKEEMKKLNKEQFHKYIKKNGITLVRLSKRYVHIPKDTILWFGEDGDYISTYNSNTENKNKRFNYEFDYEWLFDTYEGYFIINEVEKIEILKIKYKGRTYVLEDLK